MVLVPYSICSWKGSSVDYVMSNVLHGHESTATPRIVGLPYGWTCGSVSDFYCGGFVVDNFWRGPDKKRVCINCNSAPVGIYPLTSLPPMAHKAETLVAGLC